MTSLNKILKKSGVYSVEYSGLWSIKLSVPDISAIYDNFPDITIEFNEGLTLIDTNGEQIELYNLFNLYGSDVKESSIIDNQIEIIFDNGFIAKSFCSPDEIGLVDRCWSLKVTGTGQENYLILNDCYELFVTEEIKQILGL